MRAAPSKHAVIGLIARALFAVGAFSALQPVVQEARAQVKDDSCFLELKTNTCMCDNGSTKECLFDKDCGGLYPEQCIKAS
jgi:hypothetical protein